MATITLTIPDAQMSRVVDAWGRDWSSTLPDGTSNPQTKAQYARDRIRRSVITEVRAYEAQIAATQAAESIQEVAIT